MLGFLRSGHSGQLTEPDKLGSERWQWVKDNQIRALVGLGRYPLGDCQRNKNAVMGEKHLVFKNGAWMITHGDGRG